MTDPNIGRLLADRYQLMELVGRGAMGRVYRARHVLLDAPVAVKFLSQTLLNQKMRDRFKREARACFSLGQKSQHIVQVLDYGVSEDEVPFYVMEYLEGRDLSAIIKREQMPLPRFLNLAHQICLGLQAAHQGIAVDDRMCPIIHRDIKPSNLLVTQDPEKGEVVKILDFGIAKLLQEDQGQTSHFMGTLAYSSPEQMEGKELDNRSDIYSLGIVMYEMLTGKMPLYAETHSFGSWYKAHREQVPRLPSELNPNLKIPKALELLVLQCLGKKPGDRPQSVGDILRSLEPMEHRYRPGRAISRRIETTLSRAELATGTDGGDGDELDEGATGAAVEGAAARFVDPDTLCRLQSWPKNKPVAEIVFPQLVPTSHSPLATVWVMLPQRTIRSLQVSTHPTSVSCRTMGALSPHPMMLWLTVLYVVQDDSGERRPKWLPCYLDLKQERSVALARILSDRGRYRVLFFALEEPQNCAHVAKITLSSAQCEAIRGWIERSAEVPATQASLSKNQLKQELERLKPQIMLTLESQNGGVAVD
ncbi:MAG: serine/threonine protein kinase [Cyanobacteria bacterium]|nr:serine/threonine protein kinase [Cyanobacteriota bacterium]